MKQANRIFLDLQDAINLSLQTVNLKKAGTLFNIFYVVDKPGAGKTMLFRNLAEQKNFGFLAYSPALERVEKFGGIPDIYWENKETKDLRTVWSKPQMISEINDVAEKNDGVLVLLDDWHLCTEELQQIGFELFTYYSLNGHKVAPQVVFALAGNESSAAGARVTLSAIRNRCTVIYTHSNPRYWLDNFAIPNQINPSGISFFNLETNWDLFQEEESVNEQFGSPRSWTSAFNLITEIEKSGLDLRYIQSIMQGSVSSAAAHRFMMHYEIFSRINLEDIFDNKKWVIPSDSVDRYRLCMAVGHEFYNRFVAGSSTCGGIYTQFLDDLSSKSPEMCALMLSSLKNIAENKERGYLSGMGILTSLIKTGCFTKEMLTKLKDLAKTAA